MPQRDEELANESLKFAASHHFPDLLTGPGAFRRLQGGVKVSADERSLLVSKFSTKARGEGAHDRGTEDKERTGADGKTGEASSASAAIDYDAFVRWLSEGGGLDDALLGKVQRHLRARLSK